MFTSFSTALSALSAHSTAIDVVANNLANLNTPGFKASAVAFHDLVTTTLGTGLGETQVGFGVGRPTTLRQFTQGAIQSSEGNLDAAIQGDGFLIVQDTTGATLYTRGGQLQVDGSGTLLTSTGQRLQGWIAANGVTDANAAMGDIVVPVGTMKEPIPTNSFSFDLNLDATASAGPPPDTFSTAIEVFDSLGGSHVVSVSFSKSATANEWDYTIQFPDADVTTPVTPVTGTVTFDENGALTSPAIDGTMPSIQVSGLSNGGGDMDLTWELYDGPDARITQYAQSSAVAANEQDGAPAAQLIQVGISDGGAVIAQYSDGEQRPIAQLAMAAIRNPQSLIAAGNNNYQLSARSALPAIGLPGTGGRGVVLGGAIENSTVDIAEEFTNLIVLQRGYQANSRVVTTVDELSQETINLKR